MLFNAVLDDPSRRENKFSERSGAEPAEGLYRLEWTLTESDRKVIEESAKQINRWVL